MNNIIIDNVNLDNDEVKSLICIIKYFNYVNDYYFLGSKGILLNLNFYNFIISSTLFLLYYFLFINSYKNYKNIYNDMFYIFVTIESYRNIINNFRVFFKLYEETTKNIIIKYNFFIEFLLICFSFIFLIFNILFSKNRYNYINPGFNIIFFVVFVSRVVIRWFIYIITVYLNDPTLDFKLRKSEIKILENLCDNNELFINKKYKINKNMFLINFSKEYENTNCLICLENFKNNNKIVRLSCNHYYHKKCIINWILINNKCPICRNIIV